MALMGKHKAQGFDNWWEWLWFFYPNGVKTFIAFGFFYFFGWHMYYQRSLLDSLSVKKLFFLLVIFIILLTPANYYLWRYLDSPYEEQSDFFKEHAEKYRPERDVTFNVDMSQFDFSKFELRPLVMEDWTEREADCVSQLHHPKSEVSTFAVCFWLSFPTFFSS